MVEVIRWHLRLNFQEGTVYHTILRLEQMARKKSAVKEKSAARQRRPRSSEPVTAAPTQLEEADPKQARHRQASFYIVAIGSSAGGVEALEEFFRHLPDCPDAAFIVLSHQSPHHRSLLPELLRRWTSLPVVEVTDGLAIQHGHVYLPPPGTQLAILHAVFHLVEGNTGVRPVLPIDYCFSSLAEDQQEKAIGIILSGTGADGSLGIKAIKAESGVTMAQDPQSAKYAGMPQHAISTGAVDFVKPASELGFQLCDFLRHRTVASRGAALDDEQPAGSHEAVALLADWRWERLSLYKDNTTLRRIERRMNIHQIATMSHYPRSCNWIPQKAKPVSRTLIGVTTFFRDRPVFDALAQSVPQLLDG